MVIPLQSHTPAAARKAYLQWLRLFGPPERVYVDLGTEFKGTFMFGSEVDSTYYEPASLEMPTQRGRASRNEQARLSRKFSLERWSTTLAAMSRSGTTWSTLR